MKYFLKTFIGFICILLLGQFSALKIYPGWFKHYGGTGDEAAYLIQQTSDGGYIVAGRTATYTYGGYDYAIYKLDSNGNKVWFRHYGGPGNDYATSIQQTSDGGYIVAGYTDSYTYGNEDLGIYKLTSSGNKTWFKHYGGANDDRANSIQQTSDGSYIIAGKTNSYTYGNSDFAIYKLNSSGNKVWFKHYGGTGDDAAYSIQQLSGGGYIVAGTTDSYTHGSNDFAIYKLNSSGNKTWFKHYGGTGWDVAYSAEQTSDGGYIVTGTMYSYSYGSGDFGVYKLYGNGNKNWFKHYGGTGLEYGNSIQQTSDGGYVVAGYTDSYTHGNYDFAIYRLNSSGNKTWFKHYGGTANDYGESIQQTTDGGYIVAGQTYSYSHGSGDFAIYKLNSNGNK